MNTTGTIVIAVFATTLVLALSPSLLASNASARITPQETCTNHGGHVSDGPCNGNTGSNKKTEDCTNVNPAGKAPPGQQPCS